MQANDINCIGDALIQGDMKVNGKLNNDIIDVDSNCIIIDVCRRLDLSAVGNTVEIQLPDGYVCDPRASGTYQGTLYLDAYGSSSTSWTTNADISIKYVRADDSTETTVPMSNISNYNTATIGLTPFVKSYIKISVTTAAVGTNPYVVISGKIYCHKE